MIVVSEIRIKKRTYEYQFLKEFGKVEHEDRIDDNYDEFIGRLFALSELLQNPQNFQ